MPDDVSVRELRNHTAEVLRARAADALVQADSQLRAEFDDALSDAVDEDVASAFAELVAGARRRGWRPKVRDAWIAATARARSVAVLTQGVDLDGLGIEVGHV